MTRTMAPSASPHERRMIIYGQALEEMHKEMLELVGKRAQLEYQIQLLEQRIKELEAGIHELKDIVEERKAQSAPVPEPQASSNAQRSGNEKQTECDD